MANNSQHINYTFTDIEKYLLNNMSATERHLMEKATLTDPFLADAMEGYEAANLIAAKQHLSNISNKLITKKEEKEYTLEDIERYLQGNMTAAEMHAIEKAALKDPFLADAMEGYEEVDFSAAKQQMHVVSDKITSKEETSPHYNFNDIEQYIENKMPSAERHTMEKTALKEPFLSDAIEGYEESNLNVAKQHLTNIETAILGEEKEDTKVVAMNAASNNKMWLRIAAAIILMVGVGSTLWLVNKNEKSSVTAYIEPTTIKEKPTVPSAVLPSTVENKKTDDVAINKKDSKQVPSIITEDTKPTSAAPVAVETKTLNGESAKEAVADMSINDGSLSKQSSAADNSKDKESKAQSGLHSGAERFKIDSTAAVVYRNNATAKAKKEASYNYSYKGSGAATNAKPTSNGFTSPPTASNVVRGNVVNTNGEPVPFARVDVNRNGRSLSPINADASGKFNYYSTDTVLNANVTARDYAVQNATISANTMNTIVLQRNDQSLSETIVTENIGQKRKQITTEATLGTPVGGIKSFEDYVSKKKETLKKDSTEEEYVEALVELEFDVDRLGKPYNISVTNSNTVDATASNKAIQIVKEGPAWIADKKKKKAKVTIKL